MKWILIYPPSWPTLQPTLSLRGDECTEHGISPRRSSDDYGDDGDDDAGDDDEDDGDGSHRDGLPQSKTMSSQRGHSLLPLHRGHDY